MSNIIDFFEDHGPILIILIIVLSVGIFFGADFFDGEKLPDLEGTTVVVDKETEYDTRTTKDKDGNRHTRTYKEYYIYFQGIERKEVSYSRYRNVKVGDEVKYRTWVRIGKFTGINYTGDEIIWN